MSPKDAEANDLSHVYSTINFEEPIYDDIREVGPAERRTRASADPEGIQLRVCQAYLPSANNMGVASLGTNGAGDVANRGKLYVNVVPQLPDY